MAEKVTIMKLKVDLECEKCERKVKKLLCKYRQIQGQQYDRKENIVKIEVVCCSPEKLREKLCYNGGGSIKSIEIVEAAKPKKGVTFANPISKTRYFEKDTTESDEGPNSKRYMNSYLIPVQPPVRYYPSSPLPPLSNDAYYAMPLYDNYAGGTPRYDDNCPIM